MSSLFLFLTVVQAIVAAALVGVVLMQRSEGGGLGIGGGGNPGGALGARGAADFLTRATKWLAVAFVGLSIALAAVAVDASGPGAIDSTIDRNNVPAADPLGSATGTAGGSVTDPAASTDAPAQDDPLAAE